MSLNDRFAIKAREMPACVHPKCLAIVSYKAGHRHRWPDSFFFTFLASFERAKLKTTRGHLSKSSEHFKCP